MTVSCSGCPLEGRSCVKGFGPPPEGARAVIVGEAPGQTEGHHKVPFIGRSGQLLRSVLSHVGLDPGEASFDKGELTTTIGEVYYTNVVKCHPPHNRLPLQAVQFCKGQLADELRSYSQAGVPIVLLGIPASKAVIGSRFESKMRGRWQKGGKVLPTWHTAFLLREPARFWEFLMAMRKIARGPLPELQPLYKVVETPGELDQVIQTLSALPLEWPVAYDLETDQTNWWRDGILSLGLAWGPDEALVIPGEWLYKDTGMSFLDTLFDLPLKFVAQNGKFDVRFLRYQTHTDNARVDYDTLLAHYTLYENFYHDLKRVASDYFDAPDYEAVLVSRYLKKKGDWYSKIPRIQLYYYNALDVCYTWQLWHELCKEMESDGLFQKPFLFPLMEAQRVLTECELQGVLVDKIKLGAVSVELGEYAERIHALLEGMCGRKFNPRSPKQVSPILYEHYGCPIVRGRKFKPGSTCEEARQKILARISPDSEAATWIINYAHYRSIAKIKSSYVDSLFGMLGPDGRAHTDFWLPGAETGRLSARKPPLHSIPKPGTQREGRPDWGLKIRGAFVPQEGWFMFMGDYSQAEMRVAAAMSEDPFLLDAYRQGKDLHNEAARTIYGDEYTKRNRQVCKSVNFSQIYGGSVESAASEADMDRAALAHLSSSYHEMYARLYQWKDDQFAQLKRVGYVSTPTGRRRRFPLITNANRDEARKASVNAPVQGTASELTLISLIRMYDEIQIIGWQEFVHLLLTIHDSIVGEVHPAYLMGVAKLLRRIMVETGAEYFPQLPWVVDIEAGFAWGELKTLEVVG